MPVLFTAGNASGWAAPSTGTRIVIGDFDNDGDLDFFGQQSNINDPWTFYANNYMGAGLGTYTTRTQAQSPFNGLTFIAGAGTSDNWRVGDFDGDGDDDLIIFVTATQFSGGTSPRAFRNDGGSFTPVSVATVPSPGNTNSRLVTADFDNDGIVDVLYQTGNANTPYGFARGGSGMAFTLQAQSASPFSGVTLEPGNHQHYADDFDGDGDIDLWQLTTATNGYFRNDNGTFVAADYSTFPNPGSNVRVVTGDFDNDGDADILYQTGAAGTEIRYARSNGDGTFTDLALSASPFKNLGTLPDIATINYRPGDYNNDGRLDLYVVSGSVANIYYGAGAAPELLSSTPADNATGVATTANIVLTFDQNVFRGTGTIRIYRASDDALIESIGVTTGLVTGANATWTINPSTTLAAGVAYYVQIDATAFIDLNGGAYAGIDDETTLNFTTASAGGVANDDTGSVNENGTITGASVTGNDTGFTSVTAVNGNAGNVGAQITLASGARLTLNSNGTYSYNPNGAFNNLAAAGSGASNTTATDSFSYTINGGDTATVTITVNGVDSTGDVLQGTTGVDTMNGGAGNDILNGGDGDDELSGGAGSDILNGQNDDDVLNGGDGADKLYGLTGQDELNGGAGNDYMYGGDGVDTLSGGDGNDMLDGGTGGDAMTGGLGNDVYLVDNSNDQTIEAANEGYDIVRTALTWTLADNIEGLELQGSGNANGFGNSGANNLQGNDGDNFLYGYAGVDTINGNDGDDVIVGGEGNDLLRGGLGADTFRVEHAFGSVLETDQVYDFNTAEGDKVDLSDAYAGSISLVAAFSKQAGQMTLTFAGGITTLRLDVNGDGKADYQMKINGDVTGDSGGWSL